MAAPFLVISFQRSGLNWLRHCTEYFTGVRTPGRKQLVGEGSTFFDRAHDVRRGTIRSDYAGLYDATGDEVYERVALLVRHPLACFTSHYFGRKGFDFKKGLKHFEAFAVNINAFDRLAKAKKAVFFSRTSLTMTRRRFPFLAFPDRLQRAAARFSRNEGNVTFVVSWSSRSARSE